MRLSIINPKTAGAYTGNCAGNARNCGPVAAHEVPLASHLGHGHCYLIRIKTTDFIRIMLVDDEARHLRLLGLYLERYGFIVTTADSGEEAIELAHAVDVALVDMQMPTLNGLETITHLRRRNPDLKVIATSARPERDFRLRLDRLGVEDFLMKPYPVHLLVQQVQRLVGAVAA